MTSEAFSNTNRQRRMRVLSLGDFVNGKKYSKNVAISLSVLKNPVDLGALCYLERHVTIQPVRSQ